MTSILRKAFEDRPVWTYHGLISRFGESSRRRVEPRLMNRALKLALREDRGFIVEALPRIYVHRAADRTVANDAANCVVQLGRLRDRVHEDPTGIILEGVLSRVAATQLDDSPTTWHHRRRLGGDVHLSTMDRMQLCEVEGKSITIWVSHDITWIQLHETRLWRFIEMCWQRESAGMIVARKIEPAVFALLKALGFQGLQYYSLLEGGGGADDLTSARGDLRWVRTQAVETITNHAMMGQVERVVAQVQPLRRDSLIYSVIDKAIATGFAGSRAPTAEALLDWWKASGLHLPQETIAALTSTKTATGSSALSNRGPSFQL